MISVAGGSTGRRAGKGQGHILIPSWRGVLPVSGWIKKIFPQIIPIVTKLDKPLKSQSSRVISRWSAPGINTGTYTDRRRAHPPGHSLDPDAYCLGCLLGEGRPPVYSEGSQGTTQGTRGTTQGTRGSPVNPVAAFRLRRSGAVGAGALGPSPWVGLALGSRRSATPGTPCALGRPGLPPERRTPNTHGRGAGRHGGTLRSYCGPVRQRASMVMKELA